MNAISLSIIIPCYNVEDFITDCLDSIYSQDIPENKFEVICVDDCSNDRTVEIIFRYKAKHSNLILIENEINRKQGAARNAGIKIANGEYIWFIDSDDWIKKMCFSELLTIMQTLQLDVLNFNYFKVDKNQRLSIENKIESTELTTGEILLNRINIWENLGACRRIYNFSYLKSLNILFKERKHTEDTIFSIYSVYHAKRIVNVDKCYYYYRWNASSTTNNNWDESRCVDTSLAVGELMCLSNELQTKSYKLSISIKELATSYFKVLSKQFLFMHINERNAINSVLSINYRELLNCDNIKGWRKFMLIYPRFFQFTLSILSPGLRLLRDIKNVLRINYKFID